MMVLLPFARESHVLCVVGGVALMPRYRRAPLDRIVEPKLCAVAGAVKVFGLIVGLQTPTSKVARVGQN